MTTVDYGRVLDFQLQRYGLPLPRAEYRFHATRKWRFDRAWPDQMVAVEVEGGAWIAGRHTRGSGFEKDCEKYNAAGAAGWRVFRFTPGMIRRGEAVRTLVDVLQRRAA